MSANGTSCSYGNGTLDFAELVMGTVLNKIPYGDVIKTVYNATTDVVQYYYSKVKPEIATNQNIVQFIENANALAILGDNKPLPKALRMQLKNQGDPETTNRTPILYAPFSNGEYYFKLQYQVDQRQDDINWDTLVSTQIELNVVEDNTYKIIFGIKKGTLDLCAHTTGGFVEEYNVNPIRDIQTITADTFYGAEFGYDQKYKEFKFTPNRTYDYVIETKGKIDAYLEIFDENGNSIIKDDDSGVGQNARIIQHLIAGKTYKIKVRHSNPLRYGSTSLIIHKKDAITELGKSYSSASNGERTYSNDSIWFEFFPQSNAIYTISTGSKTSEDTYLTIYDEQYNVIAFDDDSGEGRNALIDIYLLQNKKYYIKANKYNNTSGTFTTVVTKQQMLPKYADWELNEGEFIYYRITVTDLTTGSYKMSAFARTGSTQDTYLTLLDNNFNYLTHNDDKSSSDRSSEIIYTLEAGKTYYLQLRLFSASTNAEGKIEITKV